MELRWAIPGRLCLFGKPESDADMRKVADEGIGLVISSTTLSTQESVTWIGTGCPSLKESFEWRRQISGPRGSIRGTSLKWVNAPSKPGVVIRPSAFIAEPAEGGQARRLFCF